MPKATVAIIFFNAMPYLPLAVESTLRQTFRDFELLLIDDGSTDGSLAYCKSITDNRVRIVSDGLNKKLNVRLNESVRLARGDFYFRMDGDDVMLPDRLETQLRALERFGDNVIVGAQAISIDKDGAIRGLRVSPTVTSWWAARHSFIHPTVAARTQLFREHPYNEHFMFHRSQDAELWCRLYNVVPFQIIPQPLIFYREASSANLENYLATGYGLLALIYRSRLPVVAKMWIAAGEMLKIYSYFALTLLRRTKILVKLRVKEIPESRVSKYRSELEKMLEGMR